MRITQNFTAVFANAITLHKPVVVGIFEKFITKYEDMFLGTIQTTFLMLTIRIGIALCANADIANSGVTECIVERFIV